MERWLSAQPGGGSDEGDSQAVFEAYVEAGGNVIDTADVYSDGRCEEMLGGFITGRGLKNQLGVATKAGFPGWRAGPE